MRIVAHLAAACALTMSGCMGALSTSEQQQLTIAPAQYRDAFDAAARIVREMGYKVVVVDRSNGIIETDARHAGSALEPWRLDNASVSEVTANTVANRRRRIRFEFIPASARLASVGADDVLRGAAIPGSTAAQERFDVQSCVGPIDVEIWVYVERSFLEGNKPSTYSGSLASRWSNPLNAKPLDAADDSIRENPQWVPVGRDVAYEQTIEERLAASVGVR